MDDDAPQGVVLSPRDHEIRARLQAAAGPDEAISPISPVCLARGAWWPRDRPWPDGLAAGVLEPRRGYRFRPENVALGALLAGTQAERICDLGAGSGSLALLAAYHCAASRVVAVELQAEQASRCERTFASHALRGASVVHGDLRDAGVLAAASQALAGAADLVVCNPPFFPAGWGRASRESSTHHSTHAVHGGLREFAAAAASLLAEDGRAFFVFDANRLTQLLTELATASLYPTSLWWIPDQRPGMVDVPFRVWVAFARTGLRIERL